MNGSLIRGMVTRLEEVFSMAPAPKDFVLNARAHLIPCPFTPADVADFVAHTWDTNSCLPHLVDTDDPPFLIDLYACNDWCLRVTIWPALRHATWRDCPHSHFGHIATTGMTPIAYYARTYKSFEDVEAGRFDEIPLTNSTIHMIHPETIHEVVLPDTAFGISLSVRSRAVVSESLEYDRGSRTVKSRTKSAADRKSAVLNYLMVQPQESI